MTLKKEQQARPLTATKQINDRVIKSDSPSEQKTIPVNQAEIYRIDIPLLKRALGSDRVCECIEQGIFVVVG